MIKAKISSVSQSIIDSKVLGFDERRRLDNIVFSRLVKSIPKGQEIYHMTVEDMGLVYYEDKAYCDTGFVVYTDKWWVTRIKLWWKYGLALSREIRWRFKNSEAYIFSDILKGAAGW